MRNGIKQMGAKVASWTLMAAVLLVGLSGVSFAADPKPKVVVSTTYTPYTLTASVDLMQMLEGAENPTANGLTTYIEQHFPTTSGTKGWYEVAGSKVNTAITGCCEYANGGTLGSLAEVATVDYQGVCSTLSFDPAANSIRVVALVTVTNAQKGTNSKIFLGRSISMANPCKQPS